MLGPCSMSRILIDNKISMDLTFINMTMTVLFCKSLSSAVYVWGGMLIGGYVVYSACDFIVL